MDAFAKYDVIDWLIMLQVILIWLYMAYRTGQWIVGVMLKRGWRWWNRKDKKSLAMDAFYDAFSLGDIQPGKGICITTESGMKVTIIKPKLESY